jgi:hypothetical protein
MRWHAASAGVVFVVALLGGESTATAQHRLAGCVTDSLGLPLPGVEVRIGTIRTGTPDAGRLLPVPDADLRITIATPALLTAQGQAVSHRAVTDAKGCYTLRDLAPGNYTVEADPQGLFASYVRTIKIGGDARVEIALDDVPALWNAADAVLLVKPVNASTGNVVEVFKQRVGLAFAGGAAVDLAGAADAPLPSQDECVVFLRLPARAAVPGDPRFTHRRMATYWMRDGRISRVPPEMARNVPAAKASDFISRLQVMGGQRRADVVQTVRQDPNWFSIVGEVLPMGAPTLSLEEWWAHADAVVRLRIEASLGAKPWPASGSSRVICTELQAVATEVLKSHPSGGPQQPRFTFLQTFAGSWTDTSGKVWSSGMPPEVPYSVGQELIAFLQWRASDERFARTLVLTVRDGRVYADDPRMVGVIADGTPVGEVLARLRAKRTSGQDERLATCRNPSH